MFAHTEKKQSFQEAKKLNAHILIESGISVIEALPQSGQFAILDKESNLHIWDCTTSHVVTSGSAQYVKPESLTSIAQPKDKKVCLASKVEASTSVECTYGSSKLNVYVEGKIKARSINVGHKISNMVSSASGEYLALEMNKKVMFVKFNLEDILALDKSPRLSLFRAKLNPIDMSVVVSKPRLRL